MTNKEAIKLLKRLLNPQPWEPHLNCATLDVISVVISTLEKQDVPDANAGDTISRQAAIDALRGALYEYEDKTEKQFVESDDLDVEDWIQHRIFVQNMSDIDRQTILELPSAQPEPQWIPVGERLPNCNGCYLVWRPHFFGGEIGMPSICYFDGQNTWHDSYGVDFERVLSSDDVTAWMSLPEPYMEDET